MDSFDRQPEVMYLIRYLMILNVMILINTEEKIASCAPCPPRRLSAHSAYPTFPFLCAKALLRKFPSPFATKDAFKFLELKPL